MTAPPWRRAPKAAPKPAPGRKAGGKGKKGPPAGRPKALTTTGYNPPRTTPSMGNGGRRQRIPRHLSCWDANHLAHIPLPRSTGPYTVTRVTTRLTVDKAVNIFGTYRRQTGTEDGRGEWSNIFCISDVAAGNAVNAANNAEIFGHTMTAYTHDTSLSPSAFTVQICNPQALQTTTGMTYVGTCAAQLGISNSSDTWTSWANRFVSTMKPMALSASTIALSSKQVSAYPLDLESLCDFTEPGNTLVDQTTTWNNTLLAPAGFSPILLFNPGGAALEVLVTTEWRTRFSLSHPAASSHSMHKPTPETQWHKAVTAAASLGHGVVEVASAAATVASVVGRFRGV